MGVNDKIVEVGPTYNGLNATFLMGSEITADVRITIVILTLLYGNFTSRDRKTKKRKNQELTIQECNQYQTNIDESLNEITGREKKVTKKV